MTQSEWHHQSAGALAEALAARQLSAVELAQSAIARIERLEPRLNAVCVRDFDRALDAAQAADAALARGERRPLLGVLLLVKESFNVGGLPTTWGMPAQRDFIAAEDALAVTRLKAAGAVVLGKTNVPLNLGDWQSYNDIYGVTNNPYDPARTPGGSSGGSAASLAAGYVPLALGSDIGGSLRVPAHFCGIYAHKPSHGLLPGRGHTPPPFQPLPDMADLAVIGPMARSATDLSLLLDILAGPDELDVGVAYRLDLPPPRHGRLADHRVLVLDTHPLTPTAVEVRAAIDTLAGRLATAGVRILRASPLLPDLAAGARLYMRLLMSFLGANIPAEVYGGIQRQAADIPDHELDLSAERARGLVLSHRDWVIADRARARLRAQWRALFQTVDAVICPVTPTTAFPHDHSPDMEQRRIVIDGRPYPYSDQLIWAGLATTPGLPATAIPIGLSPDGLPIGVQIIGPWLEDRTPLKLAELIEREFGGFVAPPGV